MDEDNFDDFVPLAKKKKTPVKNLRSAKKINVEVAEPQEKSSQKLERSKGGSTALKTSNKSRVNSGAKKCGRDKKGKCPTEASTSQDVSQSIDQSDGLNPEEARCPVCQMPLGLLRIESPEWHVTECLRVPFSTLKDCPAGIKCDSTIPSHYKKFKHAEFLENSSQSEKKTDVKHPLKTSDVLTGKSESENIVESLEFCDNVVDHPPVDDNESEGDGYCSDQDIFACVSSVNKSGNLFDDLETKLSQSCTTKIHGATDEDAKEANFYDDDDEVKAAAGSDGNDEQQDDSDTVSVVEDDYQKTSQEFTSLRDVHASFLCPTGPRISQGSKNFPELQSSLVIKSPGKTKRNISNNAKDGTSQGSILSFFAPPKNTAKSLASHQSSYSPSKSQTYEDQTAKKSSDHETESFFVKQFNRIGNSSVPTKATGNRSSGRWTNIVSTEAGESSSVQRRACPFYKKIPGTQFTVDAFCYGTIPGCSAYFLSHFHYDHYRGLSKKFAHPIYCSQVTGNLVKKKLNVDAQYINALSLNKPFKVEGVTVTLLDANHCPGSVLFLFRLPDGSTVLHTGDFRADPSMEVYPELQGVPIKQLYLDTTYCDEAYAFPPQQEVISATLDVARKHISEYPNSLVVVGAYTIGKERIFLAIAEEFDYQVCVTKEKQRILECLACPVVDRRVTTIGQGAKLHVLPMKQLNLRDLSTYLAKFKGFYDNLLAFEPTGWTHSRGASSNILKLTPKVARDGITIYGVPYSEHSSFLELKRFVQWCQPQKIIPTVNAGSPKSRAMMERYFKSWLSEKPPPKQTHTSLRSYFC